VLNVSNYDSNPDEMKLIEDFELFTSQEIIKSNALIYIAGYVAHKFRNQFQNLGLPTKSLPNPINDWTYKLSKGNCMYPSTEFLNVAKIMDHEFEKFHGNSFSNEWKIFDKLTIIICNKINDMFPKEVIACLVRTRTYIRLRIRNSEIVENNLLRQKNNKMRKICNKENVNRNLIK
ncbi:hypothetical protein ALC60_04089, partial [Trachymyrmex zeteki]